MGKVIRVMEENGSIKKFSKVRKSPYGVDYVVLGHKDFYKVTDAQNPICDTCFEAFEEGRNAIYIPVLNEMFCYECGMEKLANMEDGYGELDIQYLERHFNRKDFE